MSRATFGFLSVFFLMTLFYSPNLASAFTDYSLYRIRTGEIYGEENANNALQRLKSDTGWWANSESTGRKIPYYQLYSGSYFGENTVNETVKQFRNNTGFNATYQPVGTLEPYKKIVSGYYYGEENVRRIVQNFINNTGYSASYVKTGDYVFKKKLISGGFVGEENTKNILQQFQAATGIPSTYESTGEYQQYYQFISGNFYGESNVKAVLQNFVKNTGLNASYEPVEFSESYSIVTGWFAGEANVQAIVNQMKSDLNLSVKYEPTELKDNFMIKFDPLAGDSLIRATTYLDQKGWWYDKTSTGTKLPTSFHIVSEQTVDNRKLDNAISYFRDRSWWGNINPTGQKGDRIFRIVSNPLSDEILNKGLDYFNKRGWWITAQTTDEKDDAIFNIVSEPLLGSDRVGEFFKKNGWWYTTQAIDKMGYSSYRIITQPLLGIEQSEKALNFFNRNGLWATSEQTGTSEDVFNIVTGTFQGYENTLANAQILKNHYGWWVTTEKVQNGPQVTTTSYNLTLNEMINLQMSRSPQTDKYRYDPAYIYSTYISNNKITDENVNVRTGPNTNYEVVAQLDTGFNSFKILGYEGAWTKISLTWKNAKPQDVEYYLNPNNSPADSVQYFQFLKLSKSADINIDEVNEKILNSNTGSLRGTAGAFAQAAQLYNINELYLIAHALHETGNGSSTLAKGVVYNDRVVYNMYGYGAFDSCPVNCGAQKAYEEGWFTPELAIIGGARLIGNGYIYNTTFQQDTLYKMRWNPVVPYHQYATDIGWAAKQVTNIYNFYQLLDNYTLYIDLPTYR
jgi:beta-N-acetylglucosaminidase